MQNVLFYNCALKRAEQEDNNMDRFLFYNPVRVYFGEGMIRPGLERELPKVGHKVLLAYGGGSIKRNGVYDTVVEMLKATGKEIVEFSGITPNPRYTEVQACAKLARERQVDFILAVGGGSVIDCARTAAVEAMLDEDIYTFENEKHQLPEKTIPMGIVLTLGGTGSDMNWLAGINDEERHEKITYAGKHAVFDIIDPTATLSVPMNQLLTGAFDTLSHYMETYFGKNECVSDEIMEAIMRNVVRSARAIRKNPDDRKARADLLWDSSLALSGLPGAGKMNDFQCHSIEHWISGYTDANHGRTLAVLHPVVYRYIYHEAPAKFSRFATEVMGIDGTGMTEAETALAGIDALERFIRELGLPTSFRELGVSADDAILESIADRCVPNPGCCKQLTRNDFLAILKECNR